MFHLNNKRFRLDVERWREKRRTGKYLQYYLKPVKDQRNELARNIDFYGPMLVVLLSSFVIIQSYTRDFMQAIAMFIAVMLFEIVIALKLREFLRHNETMHKKLWSAGAQCQESIKKIKNLSKLENLVIEILEKIEGFNDVHRKIGSGEKDGKRNTIRALLHGAPVAVGCLLPGSDNQVISAEPVIEFRKELVNLDFKAGVLVTTGFYSSEAKRAAVEDKRKAKVVLLDLYWLVELARETGHKIFPASIRDPKKAPKTREELYPQILRTVFARDKARGYLLTAVIMLIMYSFAGNSLKIGYAAFAVLNCLLSIYCLWSNRESLLIESVKTK